MAKTDRSTLKGYFESGDIPTEENFQELIDSQLNSLDDGIITDANKNVGIGQTSPTARLEVAGNFQLQLNGTADLTNGNTTVSGTGTNFSSSIQPGSLLKFGSFITSVTAITSDTEIEVSPAPTADQSSVDIYTNPDLFLISGSDNHRSFVVNAAGNVGLGVGQPTARLEVDGTVQATQLKGDGSLITNLAGANIVGVLTQDQIPGLDASKIASGTIDSARLPATDYSTIDGTFTIRGLAPSTLTGTLSTVNPPTPATQNTIVGSTTPVATKFTKEINPGDVLQIGDSFYIVNAIQDDQTLTVDNLGRIPFTDQSAIVLKPMLIVQNHAGSVKLFIDGEGKIAINHRDPQAELDVSGEVKASSFSGSGQNLTDIPSAQLSGNISENLIPQLPADKISGPLNTSTITDVPLSGKVSVVADSNSVTGDTDTQFLTELQINDAISIDGVIVTVTAISSDQALTVDQNVVTTATDITIYKDRPLFTVSDGNDQQRVRIDAHGDVQIGQNGNAANLQVTGNLTATKLTGSGSGLTNIPANQIDGIIPADNLPALDNTAIQGTLSIQGLVPVSITGTVSTEEVPTPETQNTITGSTTPVATRFTTEVASGDVLEINGALFSVTAVQDDQTLSVQSLQGINLTEASAKVFKPMLVAQTATDDIKLFMDGEGKVGINHQNPTSELDVNGVITAHSYKGSAENMTNIPSEALYGSVPVSLIPDLPGDKIKGPLSTSSTTDAPLTGKISITQDSSTITGDEDTQFLTELKVNDVVSIQNQLFTVTDITSDQEFTVDSNLTQTAETITVYKDRPLLSLANGNGQIRVAVDAHGDVQLGETGNTADLTVTGNVNAAKLDINGEVKSTNFIGSGQGLTDVPANSITGKLTLEQLPDDLPTGDADQPIEVDQIPNLSTGKITSGTFTIARIPNIPSNKITGELATDQIPDIDASKVTSGVFDLDRIPPLNTQSTTGTLITKGVADIAIAGTVTVAANTSQVTGTETQFTQDFNVNDVIKIGDQVLVVSVITDDLNLVLDAVHITGATDASAYKGSALLRVSRADEHISLFMKPSGFLGLGTSNPEKELDVAGTVKAQTFEGSGALLTDIPASQITGDLPATPIENLDASKITSGTLDPLRLPPLSASQIVVGELRQEVLPAIKTTSITGRMTYDQLPEDIKDTNQLTSDDVPDLDATKITSGVFDPARIPVISNQSVDGTLVTRGALDIKIRGTVSVALHDFELIGTDTQFTRDFKMGDAIKIGDQILVISNVETDTYISLDGTAEQDYVNVIAYKSGNFASMSTASGRELITVSGSGYLGIGTPLPRNPLDVTGKISAYTFEGSGELITDLQASELNGTLNPQQIPDLDSSIIKTGAIASDRIASVEASKISGKLSLDQLPDDVMVNNIPVDPNGIDASRITSGNIPGERMPDPITIKGSSLGINNSDPTAQSLQVGANLAHANNYDFSTSPLTVTSPTNNGGGVYNPTESALKLLREGISGQAYANMADFKLGRFAQSGTDARTQLDIDLTDDSFVPRTVMSMQSTGRIGIGTNHPKGLLHVSKPLPPVAAGEEVLDQFNHTSNTTIGVANGSYGQSFTANVTGLLSKVRIELDRIYGSSSGTIEIYEGGGMSSYRPTGKLIYSGPMAFKANSWNEAIIQDPVTVVKDFQYIWRIVNGGSITSKLSNQNAYKRGTFLAYRTNQSSYDVIFETYVKPATPLPAREEGFLVTDDGKVGIGMENPSEKVEVNGNVKAHSFPTTSDQRLKKNIRPIADAITKILAIRGVEYLWQNEGHTKFQFPDNALQLGLIAQEVEQVLPELVFTDTDGYKSLDYSKLSAVLVEGVKSLKDELTQVNTRLKQIEEWMEARS